MAHFGARGQGQRIVKGRSQCIRIKIRAMYLLVRLFWAQLVHP